MGVKPRSVECNCEKPPSKFLILLFTAITAALPLVDRLTSIFHPVLGFKVRLLLGMAISVFSVVIALGVAKATHLVRLTAVGVQASASIRHFSYPRVYRLLACGIIVLGITMLGWCIYRWRDTRGKSLTISGHVFDRDNTVPNIGVEFLNVDGDSLNKNAVTTDSNGSYIVDIDGSRGRVASYRLYPEQPQCRPTANLTQEVIGKIYESQDFVTSVNLDLPCH